MTLVQATTHKTLTFSGFPEIQKDDLPIFDKTLKPEFAASTLKAIFFDVSHFIKWYVSKNSGNFSLNKVTEQNLKDYQEYCKKELKHSPFTIRRKMNHLKALYIIAINSGKVKNNPVFIA